MKNPKYSFSPITDEARFQAAIEYIATHAGALANKVLGQEMPIDTVCLFAHSPEEYDFLLQAVQMRGTRSNFSHGATTYVHTDLQLAGQHIKILGVRAPDDTRPQVGYGDYPVLDYTQLLKDSASTPYAQEITSGRGQSLIELRHPDFDILGYVFNSSDH